MSDKVTMTALDTLHISNVRSDNLQEGDVFTVSEVDAKKLEAAGLADRGGKATDAVNAAPVGERPETREEIDAERGAKAVKASPENKMAAEPDNKLISAKSVAPKTSKKR